MTQATKPSEASPLMRMLFRIPLIGGVARLAAADEGAAMIAVIALVAVMAIAAIAIWGFPALILIGLIGTAAVLGTILVITL